MFCGGGCGGSLGGDKNVLYLDCGSSGFMDM